MSALRLRAVTLRHSAIKHHFLSTGVDRLEMMQLVREELAGIIDLHDLGETYCTITSLGCGCVRLDVFWNGVEAEQEAMADFKAALTEHSRRRSPPERLH
jgi:hypothetical protein